MGSKRGSAAAEVALRTTGIAATVRIGGVEFVLVAKDEYLKKVGQTEAVVAGAKDKRGGGSGTVTRRLFDARRRAGLTQAALAKRLNKSQSFVSQAEAGTSRVSDKYVREVLKACQLPARFGAPKRARKREEELTPRDYAGMDPVTMLPVRLGSKRDLELLRTVVWWGNGRELRAQRS